MINVNLADDEKAEINRENLRKAAGLAGIADQEDEDVLLGLRQKEILSKYDSEIRGVRKDEFTLGQTGVYNPEAERMLHRLQEELRAGKVIGTSLFSFARCIFNRFLRSALKSDLIAPLRIIFFLEF